MKDLLLTVLRDENTSLEEFRRAADLLATVLAAESGRFFTKALTSIKTPFGKAKGVIREEKPILVPILRSGLALLPAFCRFYPEAPIGHIGIRRDENTAIPHPYYCHLPKIEPNHLIFILEPMIATGQTACSAIEMLQKAGSELSQIVLISILAAPEGVDLLTKQFSAVRTHIVQVDEKLDPKKWIVPGLGDFGDRYFG